MKDFTLIANQHMAKMLDSWSYRGNIYHQDTIIENEMSPKMQKKWSKMDEGVLMYRIQGIIPRLNCI